ncbi:hypothetical protein CWO07_23445 [Vibrio splendidus]|uniref:Lipoprotein LPP20-like domain-containing protein n=1 Tax=Vibrio splendidus TaxID=29497 RepID=A0A2T5EMC3_VIBSP|nr:LPP20 family lipoprotein [Vibrio splendidus]OEF65785.1 hypothetical protein A148_06555 [Vibrio splendidus 1F-157]PTP22030.1 hypothetical protein CWO07_23445 [Vibrio splendidus]PTP67676.1 hypothetical protein CWO23_16485 [Vibrio splendidus]RIH71239.1 hypothetical protein BJG01_16970 [Vibrio splendidus]URM13516.1 LPP20 family lipoprotein [Vibrio splendidus]
MKKTIIAVSLIATIAGCQSTNTVQQNHEAMTCYFPEAYGVEAPGWVCNQTPSDLEIIGVGFTEKSIAGMSLMRKRAIANARADLAGTLQANVSEAFSEAMESHKDSAMLDGLENSTQKAEENVENVLESIVSKSLANARVAMVITDPNGNLYALAGMDKSTYDAHYNKIVDSISSPDSELWNKFNDEKAEKDLTALFQELKK